MPAWLKLPWQMFFKRLFYVLLGLFLTLGVMAHGKRTSDRGYFLSRSGEHFQRGTPAYTRHLFLLVGVAVVGTGLALAGVVLPPDHPMLNQGYGRRRA